VNNKKKSEDGGSKKEEKKAAAAVDETFICPRGYAALVDRRFDEAIDYFLEWVKASSSTLDLGTIDDVHVDGVVDFDEKTSSDENNDDGGANSSSNSFGRYPIPETTSLISNLSFREDGDNNDGGPSSVITAASEPSQSSSYSSSRATTFRGLSSLSSIISSSNEEKITSTEKQTLLLPSEATSSALAKSYRSLAFQTLADQVKLSVKSHEGNEWMFSNLMNSNNDLKDVPLVWSTELLPSVGGGGNDEENGPMLLEKTPVRMDLSHVS
jgi:hypothetical protein